MACGACGHTICRRGRRSISKTLRWIRAGCFEAMAHDLRIVLRELSERASQPTAVILDGRTVQSSSESGARAGYDGHKPRKVSKVHIAVDTLGHLLALKVTSANAQERAQVGALARQVQAATETSVKIGHFDQGYTSAEPSAQAKQGRHRLNRDQTAGSQTRLCVAPRALGGRTLLGGTLPPPRLRLRTPRPNFRRLPLARLHHLMLNSLFR